MKLYIIMYEPKSTYHQVFASAHSTLAKAQEIQLILSKTGFAYVIETEIDPTVDLVKQVRDGKLKLHKVLRMPESIVFPKEAVIKS